MAIFGRKKKSSDAKAMDDKEVKKADATTAKVDAPKKEVAKKSAPKKAAAKKESTPKKVVKEDTGNAYRVLKAPLFTEKTAKEVENGKYAFVVGNDANKTMVIDAIQRVYNVKPVKVNIIKVSGKKVRRGRQLGKRVDWKKAIITLKKGDVIDIA